MHKVVSTSGAIRRKTTHDMQGDLGEAALGGDAGRLIAEMRCGVDEDTPPSALDNKQIVSLHQLLHEAKFKDPDKEHLSPAGLPLPFPSPLYFSG